MIVNGYINHQHFATYTAFPHFDVSSLFICQGMTTRSIYFFRTMLVACEQKLTERMFQSIIE